jgi:O-antigen/teichoic acid export membrane protein
MASRPGTTGRVMRSLAAVVSSKILATLAGLILVPLHLAYWSSGLYGEWLALSAVVGYLATLDLGMNLGAVNRLTQAYARGDRDDYRRVQRTALTFYLGVAVAGTLLLAVLARLAPVGEWLGLVELGAEDAAWTLWILGCFVVWSMVAGFVSAAYRSTGDFATSQWIENGQRLVVLAGTVTALMLGGGPVALAWLQLGVLVTVTLLVVWRLRRRHPDLVPSIGGWDGAMLRTLLAPSFFFVLVIAANAIALQGSVILVSTTLGGVAVAVFVTSRTLANVVRQLVNTLVISVWPEITRLDARGEVGALRAAHSLMVAVTSAGCVAFAAALWWEGADLIAVWTRGALTADATTLRLLLALLVVQSPWVVGFLFVGASNRHARASAAALVSSLVGVGLAVALVRPWGTAGIAAALIVGDLVACCHFVVRDACRLVDEPYAPFAWRLWVNLTVVSAVALLAGWAVHAGVGGPLVLRWLAVGAATAAVTSAMTWAMWLTADDRETLAQRLRPLTAAFSGAKA